MSVMVLYAGNSIIKAKIARREQGEIAFPHAIRQLSESEYEKILARARINGNSNDYFRVNSKPYAMGESAERHGIVTPRSGTARYTKDCCGVLAAISLARLYKQGREVDYALARSVPNGIQAVISDFEESFRANNLDIVYFTSYPARYLSVNINGGKGDLFLPPPGNKIPFPA